MNNGPSNDTLFCDMVSREDISMVPLASSIRFHFSVAFCFHGALNSKCVHYFVSPSIHGTSNPNYVSVPCCRVFRWHITSVAVAAVAVVVVVVVVAVALAAQGRPHIPDTMAGQRPAMTPYCADSCSPRTGPRRAPNANGTTYPQQMNPRTGQKPAPNANDTTYPDRPMYPKDFVPARPDLATFL